MKETRVASFSSRDWLWLAGVLAAAVLVFAVFFNFAAHPFEDAAILMRYSQHLAQGHGIVWNVGEPPVDGATDFLFMVAVAAVTKLGVPLARAPQWLSFLAHLLAVALIFVSARRFFRVPAWMAAFLGAYLAAGPALNYVNSSFGTTVFALLALTTWLCAVGVFRRNTAVYAVLFALSSLLLGLVRPEGVILSLLMAAAVVWYLGWRAARRFVVCYIVVFGALGLTYFLWRWHYFGYPLPNPFYRKGGGVLHFRSLLASFHNVLQLCAPLLGVAAALGLAVRGGRPAREATAALIPVTGFTLIWVLLSNEMNWYGRFQYALLPVILVSVAQFLGGRAADLRCPRRTGGLVAALLVLVGCAGTLVWQRYQFQVAFFPDGRYDVAAQLAKYRDRGYAIATTDAGLLPLISGWRAVDTWGLNDQWVAHHGMVTPEYLDRYRPEVIQFQALGFSPLVKPDPQEFLIENEALYRTDLALKAYAEARGYRLAAAFGPSPRWVDYYYVRSDLAEADELASLIRETDYRYYTDGRRCIDYARLQWVPDGDMTRMPDTPDRVPGPDSTGR
jgi:arabinofuranosyltransferase